ncbi:MAG TPA: hypothetical protein VF794_08115 [Archangium sp.]|jgi:DNA-binding FadR family transcriptional regulator|uniref:hypothetical protein n=1 Tax=Archangium sp. TaxID=1872627 RepID=UPI002ED85311
MKQLERAKLVARIEEELERMMTRGELSKEGNLPSERGLLLRARAEGATHSARGELFRAEG